MEVVMERAVEYGLFVKNRTESFEKVRIAGSESAQSYVRRLYGDDIEIFESFFVVALDRSNKTVGWLRVSQGGTSATVVDPKLVASFAINSLASSVVLVHNHPSGNKNPSVHDDAITRKLKDGLKLFDISVLDHIILASDDYYSYYDNSRLS